jgi:hypothetical protein
VVVAAMVYSNEPGEGKQERTGRGLALCSGGRVHGWLSLPRTAQVHLCQPQEWRQIGPGRADKAARPASKPGSLSRAQANTEQSNLQLLPWLSHLCCVPNRPRRRRLPRVAKLAAAQLAPPAERVAKSLARLCVLWSSRSAAVSPRAYSGEYNCLQCTCSWTDSPPSTIPKNYRSP